MKLSAGGSCLACMPNGWAGSPVAATILNISYLPEKSGCERSGALGIDSMCFHALETRPVPLPTTGTGIFLSNCEHVTRIGRFAHVLALYKRKVLAYSHL
jgi:hypothetical protein